MRTIQHNPSHNKLFIKALVYGFLIVSFLLSGCNMPSYPSQEEDTLSPSGSLKIPHIKLQFAVNIPSALSARERLVIEVLDEVTGLSYNPQWSDMEKSTETEYHFSLSVAKGSILKYRYIKIGSTITPEAMSDSEPVRYRLAFAEDNISIHDNVTSWLGDDPIHDTGILSGKVIEINTNQPVRDILVSAAGSITFTDMNGVFNLGGLPTGTHNVVFYAMDGSYQTFQQGAVISSGMTTMAAVSLEPLPLVNITFNVIPPQDGAGAPIFFAGNFSELGNTHTDLQGGMSIKPGRMPALTKTEDGNYTISLALHAQSDLRFKFTLGDGYWNAEQYPSKGSQSRQLIVPNVNTTLNFEIFSWRSSDQAPVTFQVKYPPDFYPEKAKYIQFKNAEWTEPIPLWATGPNEYLYILFSPLEMQSGLTYRFCADQICQTSLRLVSGESEMQLQPDSSPITVFANIANPASDVAADSDIIEAYIPSKISSFVTAIELTPYMVPSLIEVLPDHMTHLNGLGADTLIFSPTFSYTYNPPFFSPVIGSTPFNSELINLLNITKSNGFSSGLYPQLSSPYIDLALVPTEHSEAWWDAWFDNYQTYILSYAKLAEISGADFLILGGKSILPSFQGGIYSDGSETDVPVDSETFWLDLIAEIRQLYHGQIFWATNVNISMDPLPEFVNQFDQIYINIDSPLSMGNSPTIEELSVNFTALIDNYIYEVYRSTQKPIILSFAYPSIDGAAQGCQLINEGCITDITVLHYELVPDVADPAEQALIYNAIFPILASREWIKGAAIRGYDPISTPQDGSSSIANKPAENVIRYWYSGMSGQ